MLKGVASEPFFSWPFTPLEITVPIRMPTVNVAKIVSVYAGRFAFRRAQKPLASGSIRTSSSSNSALTLYLFAENESFGGRALLLPRLSRIQHTFPLTPRG